MFVNTLRVFTRPNVSLRIEKNFEARLIGRVPIYIYIYIYIRFI